MGLLNEEEKLLNATAELGRLSSDLQIRLKNAEHRIKALTTTKPFKIITLCGSTRFKSEFERLNMELTLEGNVVISVGVFAHADGIEVTEQQKEQLDKIHLQKIDMADELFIVNVGGYIGSSTKNEIEYAKQHGIPVRYLEQPGTE